MVQGLIVNLSMLTAFLFFASHLFRSYEPSPSSSIEVKLAIGFWYGVAGVVVMFFSFRVSGSTMIDLRQLAIIMSASFGGLYASILTGIIISLARLIFFGGLNPSSLSAVISALTLAVFAGLCGQFVKPYWVKWASFLLLCCSIVTISMLWIMGTQSVSLLLPLCSVIVAGGLCIAYLSLYLAKTNQLFMKMKEEATKDFLTGLNNHRVFDSMFNNMVYRSEKKGEMLSLFILDIDHFKKVNDTYGHAAGDAVLVGLGKLLLETTRSFDIVSRKGGEEFAVILPDCPHKHALIIAERIRMAVQQHSFELADGSSISITVSIGVSSLPEVPKDDLINLADAALYYAKQHGRNKVCSYAAVRG